MLEIIVSVIKCTAKIVLVTVLILSAILILLQTEYGKNGLIGQVNLFLNEKYDIRLDAEGFTGIVPYDIKINRLALYDNSGHWLEINKIAFRFSWLHLFKGRLLIRQLTADSMDLSRLPQGSKSGNSKQTRSFSFPTAVYRIGLEHLNIMRLSLGEEILGRPAIFMIEAAMKGEETGTGSSVSVKVDRTDGIVGSAFMEAELKGTGPSLNINAGIEEPERGLICGILGIDSPLFVTMEGSGPIKDWDGNLYIRADNLIEIDADMWLRGLEDLQMDIKGTALIYPSLVPDPFKEFFDPETRFNIRSHIGNNNEFFLDHGAFESESALLDINAKLDMKSSIVEGAFKMDLEDISPLGQLALGALSGNLFIEGNFKGPVLFPSTDLTLTIKDFKSDELQSDVFDGKALVEFLPSDDSSNNVLHVSGEGVILGLYVPVVPEGALEKNLSWKLDITGPDKGNIKIRDLQVTGPNLLAEITGDYNKDLNRLSCETSLTVKSLERYSNLLKVDIPPGTGINAKLNTELSGPSLKTRINGELLLPNNTNESIMKITGQEIEYNGAIELSGSKVLKIPGLNINSSNGEIACSGSYDMQDRGIQGAIDLETDNLEAFSRLLNRDIKGSVKVEVSIDGMIDMLNMKMEAGAENFVLGSTTLQNLSISIAISGQTLKNEGNISFVIEQPEFTLKGDSAFQLDNKTLSFENISWEGPGFDLQGDLYTDLDKYLVQGEIHAGCNDLSVFKDLFDMEILGSADLYIKSTLVKGKNRIDCNIRANDISGPFGKTDKLDLNLLLLGDLREPEMTAYGSLAGFSNKNIFLETVNIDAEGKSQNIDFTIGGKGRSGYDILLETSGTLSLSREEQSLYINRFHGEYETIPVDLIGSFKATRSTGSIGLEPLELSVSSGKIDLYGNISEDHINFRMNFIDIPVSILRLADIMEMEGKANGSILLSGILNRPQARIQFALDNLRLPEPQYTDMSPLNITALIALHPDILEADLSMDMIKGNPLEMEMYIPINLSLSPFSFGFPEKEAINGRITGGIDLANTPLLAGIYDQKFNGELAVDIDIKGTIKSPDIKVRAELENGSYENTGTGTLIKAIDGDITSEANRFILNKISGTDGNKGRLSGNGWFEFSPSKVFPYSISLNLKDMVLFRSHTTSITVSGKPIISGTLNDRTLTGTLSIDKGEYRIPERLPTEITDLAVTEINVPEQYQAGEHSGTSKNNPMKLDMSVKAENQVYMTGRGLSSEWKGDVVIKGSTEEPTITGRLSVLRGNYNFLGKRFDLTEGTIYLDGKYPISPNIDITGKAYTAEITAIINLTGDLKTPEITLSSEPSLPSDEILSRILFGRDVSQITPLQAIELGNALNTMMGKSRYDIMGSTKEILGVDQLDVKQSEESDEETETVVSVGKYVRDDLYIEVEKGLGEETGKASVTWELTPNITVDTEMGQDSSTDVGINWKWNY